MKKTILASSLAVALGATGYSLAGEHNTAQACEQHLDKAHLADLALNHPDQLNAAPIQEGAYDYHFNYEGYKFNFTSNGNTWAWSYHSIDQASAKVETTQASNCDYKDVSAQAYSNTNTTSAPAVRSTQQSSTTNVKAVSAPRTSNYHVSTASTSAPASTGGSTKAQFLAAGGTEALWNSIVLPESGGNPNAVNPAGYRGLG